MAHRPATPAGPATACRPAISSRWPRLISEVGALARGDEAARLSTLSLDTEIAFRSPAERAAFADDLAAAVTRLAARYHHPGGRPHRLVVAAHPVPRATEESTP